MKSPPQDHLITPYFSYADDTEYSIQPIRWLLRPISVWPVSSIKERILSAVLLIVCVFLIAGTLVPCALAIFLDQNKDVETKVRDFGPLSNWVLASLKYCSLLSHVGDIRRCLEHVDADWRAVTKHEDREMMLRNAKIGRFIALFAALFMHSGVFSYSIFQAMTMNESVLGDNASMHSLPFAFYDKILDTTTSPTYEIVFIMQFLSTFVVNSVAVSTVSLIAVFVMHACYCLMFGTMVPSGLSIFIESQETLDVKLRSFGPLTFWFMAMINYSCLLLHIDDIRSCVEHMKADWRIVRRSEERQVMLKNARIGRFIVGFCAVFMHSGVLTFNTIRGLSKDVIYTENSSVLVRGLPYPFYSRILDAHYSPAYEFVFLLQCVSTFLFNSVTVAVCGLAAVFVMHACGQLRILMSWLDNLIDGNERNISVRRKFAIIVEHHPEIQHLGSL